MSWDSPKITEAVILAGGLGTRLRAVVSDLPKPMAEVGGRPFLAYQLDYLQNQGISRVILSVGYLWQTIKEYFGDHFGAITLEYAVESEPLGTGGGVIQAAAMRSSEGPLLVLNGDTWFPVSLSELASIHGHSQADITIAVREAQSAGRYGGIDLDSDNRIVKFLSSGIEQARWINGGIYLISESVLNAWQQYAGKKLSLESDFLERDVGNGVRCYGCPSDAAFIDIGVPEDYAQAFDVISSKSERRNGI